MYGQNIEIVFVPSRKLPVSLNTDKDIIYNIKHILVSLQRAKVITILTFTSLVKRRFELQPPPHYFKVHYPLTMPEMLDLGS